jgi:hypothetical protein
MMTIEIKDGVPNYPYATAATFSPPETWSKSHAYQLSPELLSEFIPLDWCNTDISRIPRLVPPPPLDCGGEINDLFAMMELRESWDTIGSEAGEPAKFVLKLQLLLEAMGAPLESEVAPKVTARLLLERLSALVIQDAGTVVMNQKALFNRPRPYQLAPGLNPPFHPSHPAYPSGHATQVMALGFVVREALRKTPYRLAGAFFCDFAMAVGRRREIAGVHYASDTVAGNLLADRITRVYLANPLFQQRFIEPFTRHFM